MASHRREWLLILALAALASCGSEEEPVAQLDTPPDDAWIDALVADTDEAPNGPDMSATATAQPAGAIDPSSATTTVAGAPATPLGDQDPVAPTERTAHTEPRAHTGSPLPSPEPAPTLAEQDGAPAPESPELPPAAAPAPPTAVEAAPAAPEPPPPITTADFHGNYRYVGGQTQRDGVTAAVEKTVQALSMALRGIARKRLTAASPVDASIDITVNGDQVTTNFASGWGVTNIVGGGSVRGTGLDGGKLDATMRMRGGKLVHFLKGNGGARTIVYVLSSDRQRLTVHHEITSKRLPVPVSYRLSYTRK